MGNLYNNLVAIPHRKRSLSKHRNRCEENVKMGVTNHSLNVSLALNHLRNNPVTKFYEHCGKQVGSF